MDESSTDYAQICALISHNLNDDSSLYQIDDFDLNYIIAQWKPLVLSTQKQLEEEMDRQMNGMGKSMAMKKQNSKKFENYSSIDSLSKKKEADNVGSLQSKSVSIENVLESSCKRSIKEFLKWDNEKGSKRKKIIGSRRSNRVSNDIQVDHEVADNVYFDPIMSLYFFFREHMLSEMWTVRQYWCANLLCLTKIIKFKDYLTLVPDLGELDTLQEALVIDLTSRAIILTLVDHFGDYQENRVVNPVRELSVKLMVPRLNIIPIKAIWVTILSSKKLYWMYKFNVLLILKTLCIEGKKLVDSNLEADSLISPQSVMEVAQILDGLKDNKKILDNVCKWLQSEDEVKIIACECIGMSHFQI